MTEERLFKHFGVGESGQESLVLEAMDDSGISDRNVFIDAYKSHVIASLTRYSFDEQDARLLRKHGFLLTMSNGKEAWNRDKLRQLNVDQLNKLHAAAQRGVLSSLDSD